MAPKPAKGSAKKDAGNKNWEAALTNEPFEEDSWRACVSLVVESCPEDEQLIQALTAAIQKPLRRLFSVLTWDDTQAKIHEFGNPKNKKRDNVPMFSEVTEPAKVLLDAGEEIPVDLLAKLIKFQLLQIKSNDKQRRQVELVKPTEEKAKETPRSAAKDKGGKDKRERHLLLCRRKRPNDEPDDGPQHYILIVGFYNLHLFSALDSIGIQISNVIKLSPETKEKHNTESNKGPETGLPNKDTDEECLIKLAAQTKRLDHFWSDLRFHLDSKSPDSKLHNVAVHNHSVNLSSVSIQETEEAMLTIGSHIFDGLSSLIYDTLNWRRQHQHYLNNLKIIDVPKLTAPDAQPVEPVVSTPVPRSKKKPAHDESLSAQEMTLLTTDVDMSHYNRLLDTVPPEACSVPLMLHCMLEQVALTSDPPVPVPSDKTEESTSYNGPFLDHQLVSCMLHHFLPLVYTEKEKSHLLNSLTDMVTTNVDRKRLLEMYGQNEEKTTDPQVVRYHDERTLRLRNSQIVRGFNPVEVEKNMLSFSPVSELMQSVTLQNHASCWMAIKQQLQYYCTNDVGSWPEVERLFDQSVFESMPLTQLDSKGVLLEPTEPLDSLVSAQVSSTAIPWDDPMSFAKQQLWHLQNQDPTFLTEKPTNTEVQTDVPIHLELSDIQNRRLRSLFDWHYTEHHSATIFSQVLQVASEQYRCLDTFRGTNKNILYIYCHNPMNKHRQFKEYFDVALHTNVKFRKYLENVADRISEWTKEEESKRQAVNSLVKTPEVEDLATTPVDKEEEPVIRKDSLKAWKLEQERLKEEEFAKKAKKDSAQKAKQTKEDTAKDKKENKAPQSAKKGRANTASSAKTITDSVKMDENKETEPTEEEFNGFMGYDMNGKLIHVSGNLHHLYPSDGGRVIVETASYVEGSSLNKVAVKKDNHCFYTHVNHIVEETTTDPRPHQPNDPNTSKEKKNGVVKVKHGFLTAVLDSGIRLSYSFYGPTGQHKDKTQEPSCELPKSCTDNNIVNQDPKVTQPENSPSPTEPADAQESESGLVASSCQFNSLSLSLPNGLLLQLLREDSQGVPLEELGMLVRQSFPLHKEIPDLALSKEVSRLITNQGAVIRNMKDGSTQVLFADGSVSSSHDSGPVWEPAPDTAETTEEAVYDAKEQSTAHNRETERGFWSTTTPSGARISTVGTSRKCLPTSPLLVFKATDPKTKEVMLTREDGVVSVQSPDGSIIVEHADGTRITSLYEDSLPIHRGEGPYSTTFNSSSVECGLSLEDHSRKDTCSAYEFENKKPTQTTIYENSHESLPGSRTSSKSENECLPIKEKVVLVEKEGCATVVMYPDRHMAHVFLADGTVITGNNKGAYQVFPSSVGLLQIHTDGKCVYTSDLLDTARSGGGATINQSGTYTMSHCDDVTCDVTDPEGNHFQVMEDGTVSVLNLSLASSKFGKEYEEEREMTWPEKRYEHSPRLFIAHENGTGTEFLLSQTVEDLLFQAYSDPTVAIMKEPLPDSEDEFGITILRPRHESMWSQWLLAKQKPDITPPNLRNRNWNDFPRAEKRTTGPPFGTDLGRSLSLTPRCAGSVTQNLPLRSCPKVLEMRELQQHRPFTSPLRNTLDTHLKEYIESLMEKLQRSEQMKIKDPRSEKESGHANDLLNLVLSYADEEDSSQSTEKQISDISSLYMQGIAVAVESDASETTSTPTCESFAISKDSQWPRRHALYRQELCEEKACRAALRKKTIVPYFHLENLPLYEVTAFKSRKSEKIDSPTALKAAAKSPTDSPHQTADFYNYFSVLHVTMMSCTFSLAESSLKTPSVQYKSVSVDVTGHPRKSKVTLPTCIKTTKPSSVPNYKFQSVEEPVRRKCRTISLTNPDFIVRGFHLHPPRVDFGPVLEGTTSSVTVIMKNVGVDTCRFHIKQPAPSTGLRVMYNPGPVAAGLHAELQIQLLALYSVQPGETETRKSLSQDITIHTETDIIYLPVTATILSERLHDVWRQERNKTSRTSKLSNSATLQPPTQP
ncbi:hypothetical protein WMY93_014382 [Mugilogobius chulae]|uniref:Sperm associated antigen 17 n=1 Tax=Mugilogobius chulae TaxID=88201 RepID=A0AAW0NZ17_9GOBI